MKEAKYILFTSGRGPLECAIAVQGVQNRFRKYLEKNKVSYEILSQKKADHPRSMQTIVFQIFTSDITKFKNWIGTIQWISLSPVRKYQKRKNWYIKCQEISMPSKIDLNIKDVVIQSYKASGPGGQHRNKVETAIRIIHNSTGIIVTASDAKSQLQNKKKAWKKLEDRLSNQNNSHMHNFNFEQWTSKLIIERGNPVRTFYGIKFKD